MTKQLAVALGLGLVTLGGGPALAGYKESDAVSINATSRYATGSLGGARNSANSIEYVLLMYQASAAGSESLVVYMRSAAGQTAACFTTSPALLAIGRSISGDSYVSVNWDASAKCTSLEVRATSYHPPKAL